MEKFKEESEMVFIHPIVILSAIISGVYTGYLGWKRFRFRRGRGSASDFPWQRHIQWGKRFYILLWVGSLIGVGALFYLKGEILTSGLHAYLAVLILLLFSIGVALGGKLSKGKGTNRLALMHMVINYSTFFFVLIQIVLGVIFLTFFLYS
jgi:heme/copper-type cytochrome/quinol oxidase subunit 2